MGFGSQTNICGFSRQNICSAVMIILSYTFANLTFFQYVHFCRETMSVHILGYKFLFIECTFILEPVYLSLGQWNFTAIRKNPPKNYLHKEDLFFNLMYNELKFILKENIIQLYSYETYIIFIQFNL